jgi:hypothetical protein
MGGVVIGSGTNCNLLMLYRKDFALSPKNACPILVYGLPTPAARMVNQQRELAHRQMTTPDGSFARPRAVFWIGGEERESVAHAAERFVDYIAEKSCPVTLAVSLG